MAVSPQYAAVPAPKVTAVPAAANAARDGSGTLVTVFTAGASGSIIERIKVKATGTTTAGMIRIFLHDGVSAFFHDEIMVLAVTPAAAVATWEGELVYGDRRPLYIPTGWTVRLATHNAEAFHASVIAGNF